MVGIIGVQAFCDLKISSPTNPATRLTQYYFYLTATSIVTEQTDTGYDKTLRIGVGTDDRIAELSFRGNAYVSLL